MGHLMMSSGPPVSGKLHIATSHRQPRSRAVLRVESFWSKDSNHPLQQKSYLSARTFWGIQFALRPLFDFQAATLGPRQATASKKQSFSTIGFSDPELHSVLELASDSELLDLSNILYGRSFLSPVLKSFTPGDGSSRICNGQPPHNRGDRDALMRRLEARFLFLAADVKAILSGHRPSYRNTLLQVGKKLQISCSVHLSTQDMESEIFLHLLEQNSRKSTGSPQAPQNALIKLRGKELLPTILKGGGAVTASALQRLIFKKLSGKLLRETLRYQLAQQAVVKTGQVAAAMQTRVAVLAARQGVIGAAKCYVMLRSTMMVLGPMLWGTLLADMLISAAGTDYARVVRAIYAFAQIRLLRTYSWGDTGQ